MISILQTDSSPEIRRLTLKALGRLGALDPYSSTALASFNSEDSKTESVVTDSNHPLNVGPSHEDYYLTLVFTHLFAILKESSLGGQYSGAIDAVLTIVRSLRIRCVTFLPQLMPIFLDVIRSRSGADEFCLQSLSNLITMVSEHIRPYTSAILALVEDFWPINSLQTLLIDIIESLATVLDGSFRSHLSTVLPMLLEFDVTDFSSIRSSYCARILRCLVHLGSNLEDYIHLVLSLIVDMFESPEAPMTLRRQAVQVSSRTVSDRS